MSSIPAITLRERDESSSPLGAMPLMSRSVPPLARTHSRALKSFASLLPGSPLTEDVCRRRFTSAAADRTCSRCGTDSSFRSGEASSTQPVSNQCRHRSSGAGKRERRSAPSDPLLGLPCLSSNQRHDSGAHLQHDEALLYRAIMMTDHSLAICSVVIDTRRSGAS